MLFTKPKTATAMLLAAGLTTAGAAVITCRAVAKDKPNDLSWIDQRVQDWQPTKEERRMDEIAWAKDLRQALRLAKENKRPVFLFTYSGTATEEHSIALRRC